MINVTKPYLPNQSKYLKYLDSIYSSNFLTNNGPLLQKLEALLQEYLEVENIILVSNGTVALNIAYKALGLKGNVITTPFSFVATTSSLISEKINPNFVDIDPETLNIDASKILSKIDEFTSGILPVHVFGNPCQVDEIESIAKNNSLKVIYDGAHAFGVKYKGQSLLNYGDITTLSFHATKIFHTIEGGAIITKDANLAKHIRTLINFGIQDEDNIPYIGTNAKMNEFQAAMGLAVLEDIGFIMDRRKEISDRYTDELAAYFTLQKIDSLDETKLNYSYYPIILESHIEMLNLREYLNEHKVYPRRYFYPSLNNLPYLSSIQKMPHSEDISSRILCLPIYPDLSDLEQTEIINLLHRYVARY